MGGVMSSLCVMLAQHGCRPSSVASSLTFVPPDPPFYELRTRPPTESASVARAAGAPAEGVERTGAPSAGAVANASVETSGSGGGLEWVLDQHVVESDFEDVEVCMLHTSRGSKIPGFLFRHPQARLTLLLSHGNAADCGSMRERCIQLVRRVRVNVFAYDYTGYGAASGVASEQHTYADIRAAYDFLVSHGVCQNPGDDLVLYGQSVGSGPSCSLAVDRSRPVGGLILHSPIMSGIRVLLRNRGPLACCDIYPNINKIAKVRCQVLIIHGLEDEEVGVHHGQALQARVPKDYRHKPCWVRGAGHNDVVEMHPSQYYQAVNGFVESLTLGSVELGGEVMAIPSAAHNRAAPAAVLPTGADLVID